MKATSVMSVPNHERPAVIGSYLPASSQSLGEFEIRFDDLHGLVCYLLEKNQHLRAALALAEKQLTTSASPLDALSPTCDTEVALRALMEGRES